MFCIFDQSICGNNNESWKFTMKEELVSIIFPVYNVEDFVKASLQSVVNQSYENIEIICIDDGSTDSSADIVQIIADRDKRIKSIHQQNLGLSGARNTGLNYCTGNYIVFLDSDDVLHPDFINILMTQLKDNKVKLVMCAFKKETEPTIVFSTSNEGELEIIERDAALKRMLLGEWWSAWAKLYHRSIFSTLRFPEGRNNEDYAIMVQILEQCPQVVYVHEELYYYLTRPNSITTSVLNIKKFDEVQNGIDVLEYVKKNHPQLQREAEFNLGASLMKLILETDLSKHKIFSEKNKEMLGVLRASYASFRGNKYFTYKQKVIMFVQKYAQNNLRVMLSKFYVKYKS